MTGTPLHASELAHIPSELVPSLTVHVWAWATSSKPFENASSISWVYLTLDFGGIQVSVMVLAPTNHVGALEARTLRKVRLEHYEGGLVIGEVCTDGLGLVEDGGWSLALSTCI